MQPNTVAFISGSPYGRASSLIRVKFRIGECARRETSPAHGNGWSNHDTVTQRDKLIRRFRACPQDFAWQELVRLLKGLGYREVRTGRSGGLRRRFIHRDAPAISLHKPHPGNIVKRYVIDDVLRLLNDEKLI